MSLVFQMISAGNGIPTNPAGSALTTTASTNGTGSLLPFAQALIQKMTGSISSENTPVVTNGDPIALLQGLLKQILPAGDAQEKTTSENSDLLSELAQDIEKLDESIQADPALLASLQGWLLQVSALLSNQVPQGEQAPSETTEALSPLAQNPETLRFAVQDDLNRLVSIINEAASEGDEALTTKGLTVLNQFSEIMSQSSVSAEKPKEVVVQNQRTTDHLVVKGEMAAASKTVVATADSGNTDMDLTSTLQTKIAITPDVKKGSNDDETSVEFSVPSENNEIVTAGQLSIRNGMTTPLKAETPPVPVHQFAKEMTGLITGKLEIVKKGGIAEATISLFPENLGQVDVKITMQNGHLIAQFVTEHVGAKDLLEQQMVQLRAALQSQGLQVEKLEVTQNNTPLQSQMQQDGRQSGSGGQQQDRKSNQRNEASTDAVTAAELSGEWKDWIDNVGSDDSNESASFSAKA